MTPARSDRLRLDDQLCFALHSASRAIVASYRPLLDEIGLTYSQYLVMLVLWERGLVPFGALASALHLDSGSLSPVVKRLEAHGLVTRHRQEHDERTVVVATTAAGDRLHALAVRIQHRVEQATGLEPDELAAMRDDLLRMAGRLRATDANEPTPIP